MRCYLGIDGGGSKTSAVLCSDSLQELSRFTGKDLNYNAIGMEAARDNLREIIDGILTETGLQPDAVCIGLSALSDRADEMLVREFCGGIVRCDKILLDSDVFIALEAMDSDGPAAVAIAGTGSMAAGRLADGTVLHTGGWGHLLGDEGSGYALASEAVKAAVRGAEGSAPYTMLTEAMLSHFGAKSLDDLIGIFYDPPIERSRFASFAPFLFDCYRKGDEMSAGIVSQQASMFADTVRALLRKMPVGTPLGLWGGVFEHQECYAALFSDAISSEFPETKTGLLRMSPVLGAVRAAMKFYEGEVAD
ncbi:MAG: hypothetical protein K6G90_10395 [Clostridia bacterium]|nr:hypothetical protein [Clostridia bacterium]